MGVTAAKSRGMKHFVLASALILSACSQQEARPDIKVEDVWARAVAPGQDSGAAYMTIRNDGGANDRLNDIKVSVAPMTMIHQTRTENGVSSMDKADDLVIPAHGTLELKPGGIHAMMMGLKVPLQPGDRFFVDLTFDKSGHQTVSGKVVAAGER